MDGAEKQTGAYDVEPEYFSDTLSKELSVNSPRRTRHHERWQQTKRIMKRMGAYACIGATITTGQAYAYLQPDINEGKAEVANSHPAVHDIFINNDPEKATVATYVATGMGTRDSSEAAEKLTSHIDMGSTFAVEYSNKEIDIYELTDTIVEHARKHGVKYLSFDGYSAGGPIELAVAAEIYEKYDDLHVLSVTMNSSPVGEGSLTEKSQEGARILGTVLQFWPDLAYSKKARLAAEVLARKDRYYDADTQQIDLDELKKEIQNVKYEKIDNEKAASGNLIASQIGFISRYLTKKNIARLAKHIKNKFYTMLFYTYSSDPTADHVVDDIRSANNLQAIAEQHSIPLDIITIDNIGHANPGERPTEYNRAIRQNVHPFIESMLRAGYGVGVTPEYGDKIFVTQRQLATMHSGEGEPPGPQVLPTVR